MRFLSPPAAGPVAGLPPAAGSDLDEEADVLYVSFEGPQGATDSELTDDGMLMRYRGDRRAGVTILNARKRIASGS